MKVVRWALIIQGFVLMIPARMSFRLVSFVFLILLVQSARGKIKLPAIISDNMVLQQQSTVPLWGEATANHAVTVTTSWNNKKYTVRSDGSGAWRVEIQTPKAGGPYDITFNDESELTLTNILVGEVWVCSGQSNMGMPMNGYANQPVLHSNEILMHANDPQLRVFQVARKISNTPLDDCGGTWQLSNPESVSTFSAVGFQFAKELQELLDVPVGIIEATWGGTPIKAWTDENSLQPFTQLNIPPADNSVEPSPDTATCLFNGMISPVVGYGIKGFLWYQGEEDTRFPYLYKEVMTAMVKGWRNLWGRGNLPFYYVQIAPCSYHKNQKDSVALLREAQAQAMKVIPHTGMVVSMDVGMKQTIHPPDKTTIAKRLLYWALGDTYNWEGIAYQSPIFESMQIKDHSVTVSFTHTSLGLTSHFEKIKGFELAGQDKVFYPAEVEVKRGGQVVLHSDQVSDPVAVRYLFKDWAEGNLYNTRGLPVAPFRTDDW